MSALLTSIVMYMNNKNRTLSTKSLNYLLICFVSGLYSLASISTYMSHGYIMLRYKETNSTLAIAVITISALTAVISGYMFKASRKDKLDDNPFT